jgi:hypothetical protein
VREDRPSEDDLPDQQASHQGEKSTPPHLPPPAAAMDAPVDACFTQSHADDPFAVAVTGATSC